MQLDGWTHPKYLASFIGNVESVISYLISVVRFYFSTAPEIFCWVVYGIVRLFITLAGQPKRTRQTPRVADPPPQDESPELADLSAIALAKEEVLLREPSITCPPRHQKREFKVSPVVGAMDGRSVQLEISFGEGFHRHRTALAWVDKPREGKPTVKFVLSPPDEDSGSETYLVQVPDEQLGDFEEVEDRNRVYRLTSVLYVEDAIREEMCWE